MCRKVFKIVWISTEIEDSVAIDDWIQVKQDAHTDREQVKHTNWEEGRREHPCNHVPIISSAPESQQRLGEVQLPFCSQVSYNWVKWAYLIDV